MNFKRDCLWILREFPDGLSKEFPKYSIKIFVHPTRVTKGTSEDISTELAWAIPNEMSHLITCEIIKKISKLIT